MHGRSPDRLHRLTNLSAVLAAGALALAASSFAAGGQTLVASVGPGAAIGLTNGAGSDLTKIRAGTYKIVVRDRSRSDTFTLVPPSGRRGGTTGRAFVGTKVWRLHLWPGIYRFRSDAHPALMHGSLRVG